MSNQPMRGTQQSLDLAVAAYHSNRRHWNLDGTPKRSGAADE